MASYKKRRTLQPHFAARSPGLFLAAGLGATPDPQVGRSEALRRSMLALIDKGAPHEAHPAYWAPFVLVGEGAAAR
jgi:hypothetical protein